MIKRKTAIVLFNLGGPLQEADIKPFLFNFFMDKNIIGAPLPVRYFIAKYIAKTRGEGAALQSYKLLGYKSPLLENTQAQAEALQDALQSAMDVKVFVCMRYWHPMAKDVAKQVKEFAPEEIIYLSLYPQYSTTTANSSFEDFDKVAQDIGLHVKTRRVCCYPQNSGFVKASADHIMQKLKDAPPKTRLLFSAHGLPEKVVQGGDPYQWQCEETAKAIVAELGIANLDWQICYQSRVGPLKWIGPSTEDALQKAAKDGVGVLVYPHAFVSEHVETLVEIEMEYRHVAHELGIPWFERVPTVGTHPAFINGLADEVLALQGDKTCNARICPATFTRCGCKG